MERQDQTAHVAAPARRAPVPEPGRHEDAGAGVSAVLVRRAIAGGPPPHPGGRWSRTASSALLHLQRTAGNAAVAWLVQWERSTGAPAASGAAPAAARRAVGRVHAGGPAGAAASVARTGTGAGVLARTEAVALEADDLAYIAEQLESETPEGDAEATADGGGAGPGGEDGPPADRGPATAQANGQADEVAALSCVVFDGGTALSGILADGEGTPVATRPLSDLGPDVAEGIAMAGVVGSEFSDAAFRSLRALGFIDLGSARIYPPDAVIDIDGFPPPGSGFKKQYRLKPTTTRDHDFKAMAAPVGTYDTGMTVVVSVGGQEVELKKLVQVTDDVAARTRRFEQEHIDDTVAAFGLSFQEAASAVNHFAGGADGASPIYFRGNSEEEVKAYVESRLTDYHGRPKLGGKREDWVAAYKKLLALTISQRDARGTHSWSLAPRPKVDRAAGTVTYQLNPPTTVAGPSFNEIGWDKV